MKKLDYRIVSIVIGHYFCNVAHLVEDEVLEYYNTLISKVNKDSDIDWNELEDYIIWEPFENTSPSDVVDNMENLYDEISYLLKIRTNNLHDIIIG